MMIHRFHSPFPPHSTNPSKTLHKAIQLLKVSRMTQPKTCVFSRTDLQSLTFISNPNSPVLLFSIAAVTNYHKHSGLKLYQLIILHFGRSEVWSGSQWVEIKVSEGHCFFGGFWGQSMFLPFPASRGHPLSLPRGPFFHLENQQLGALGDKKHLFSHLLNSL